MTIGQNGKRLDLQLDVKKSFDKVDWILLEMISSLKKFSSTWISWIMGCIRSPIFIF